MRMDVTAILVMAIIVGGIVKIISILSNKNKGIESRFSEQEYDAMLQKLQQMSERIETLEQIVTDEKYSLNKEFENLR